MRLTLSVEHGGGAVGTIPAPPTEDGGLEWHLRYSQSDLTCLQAAAVVATISYLIGSEISATEACRRLRQMRRVYREAHP